MAKPMNNTGNPVDSSDPADLEDNARILDRMLNSSEISVPDRLNNPIKTWFAIQDGFDKIVTSLDTANFTFPNEPAGLAATTEGQYFRTPMGVNNGEYAFLYFRNVNGAAVPVAQLISNGYVDARLVPGNFAGRSIPLAHDRNNNVPIWLDNGRFDAAGIGPNLEGDVAKVPNEWAQLYLRQQAFSPYYFPLFFDTAGNVPVWLHNGELDAAGAGSNLRSIFRDISLGSVKEGDAFRFNFKKGLLRAAATGSLRVAFTGDSWTEKNTIPKALISLTGGTSKDPGWISCSTRADAVMSGITLAVSNFTKYDGDADNNNAPPLYGAGPDGNAYYNNNAVGTLTWTGVKATEITLFYYDGSGSFTVSIDGGTAQVITGTATGTVKKYVISGLTSAAHTVKVTSSGTGVVSILGMYGVDAGVAKGITISRMGNGGATARDYLNWADWITPVAGTLDIDLLFIILGTNDYRKSLGIAEYINGIQTIIARYREATPDISICLISPAQSNASGTPALSDYDRALKRLAAEEGVSYISGYDLFPRTYSNAGGAWEDSLHLSSAGSYVICKKIKDLFFPEII